MTEKVELLAPAGSYEAFIGAINAGADAVYLGGELFGARAFAQNFDTDSLCTSIRYAHLFGVRVYLTLNTLIKQKEFAQLFEYIKPFYLAGLDGVIVQDFGVVNYIKRQFPHMEIHASTQMAITAKEAIAICKEHGITRVVPARELSLKELSAIREEGIEVECFVHGAMCYSYSGQCLMSSILGGRSGNRGKCAQPCRLPYTVEAIGKIKKDTYTLSLKDMSTIEHLKELIEAGMDSFKIEGRMKRSEYAAGVTSIYRKYIDMYYENPDSELVISAADKKLLNQLYIRSEKSDGYLFQKNSAEMLCYSKPNYNEVDEAILTKIADRYLGASKKKNIYLSAKFEVGEPAKITACTLDGISVDLVGDVVEAASKIPASKADVCKQLEKLGNTHFTLKEMEVYLGDGCFLPNGMLNALRRAVVSALEEAIITNFLPKLSLRHSELEELPYANHNKKRSFESQDLSIAVETKEQLKVLKEHPIYHKATTLYVTENLIKEDFLGKKVALLLPFITRNEHSNMLKKVIQESFLSGIKTFVTRNLHCLSLLLEFKKHNEITIISDTSLYLWNEEAGVFLSQYVEKSVYPFELNSKELPQITTHAVERVIYGYIPMMLTANCVQKTNAGCKKVENSKLVLRDRYEKEFNVLTKCKYCYNILYNSVPLSLHNKCNFNGNYDYSLRFTIEDSKQAKLILDYYHERLKGNSKVEVPFKEFTTAHENRQVE